MIIFHTKVYCKLIINWQFQSPNLKINTYINKSRQAHRTSALRAALQNLKRGQRFAFQHLQKRAAAS